MQKNIDLAVKTYELIFTPYDDWIPLDIISIQIVAPNKIEAIRKYIIEMLDGHNITKCLLSNHTIYFDQAMDCFEVAFFHGFKLVPIYGLIGIKENEA